MNGRWTILILIGLLGGLAGCKEDPRETNAIPTNSAANKATEQDHAPIGTEPTTEIHWMGKRWLGANTNAASLMKIWSLPESLPLEAQALDKLAVAPWRMLKGNTATNDAPIELLRPLLNDLLQEEFRLSIHHPTNASGGLALAVRLDQGRAAAWRTNLAGVVGSLIGATPTATKTGWLLKRPPPLTSIELAQEGGWLLLNLGNHKSLPPKPSWGSTNDNPALLQVKFPLSVLARKILGPVLPSAGSNQADASVDLEVYGEGEYVRIRGEIGFKAPLGIKLDAWSIPTNSIKEPVVSFVAIRGIEQLLTPLMATVSPGRVPNQGFGWSYPGVPYQTYFALPLDNASNRIIAAAERFSSPGNAWLSTNGMGELTPRHNGNLWSWKDIPFITPDLTAVKIEEIEFLLGSFYPNRSSRAPEPHGLFEQLYSNTNTIYYAWEITQERIGGWIDIGQLLRIALHRPQLPPKSRSMDFLVAAAPHLGNCITAAYLTTPNKISFTRKSSIGITGLELHLLADWLESPIFPNGLHTLEAKQPPTPSAKKSKEPKPAP